MSSRFNFIAEIDANMKEDAKVPYKRTMKGKDNQPGIAFNLIAKTAKNNSAFMEAAGFKSSVIQTYDTDKNKLNIDWDDRNKESVKKSVASWKKHTITLDGERNEFVSDYDFVDFVLDNLDEIKGKTFQITGTMEKNVYNGKVTDRFKVQNMYENPKDKEGEPAKKKLRVTTVLYFQKEGIDTADWKKEKKITVNGYTYDYHKEKDEKQGSNYYFPMTVVFDFHKLDLEDEDQRNRANINLREIGLKYEDGELEFLVKKGKVYANEFNLGLYRGAEEVEFDESQLTERQKERVRAGLAKVEDFRPKGSTYGDFQTTFKIVEVTLMGEYSDGLKVLDVKQSDFEDEIFEIPEETGSGMQDGDMNPPVDDEEEEKPKKKKKPEATVEDEDLFGDD